MSHVVHILVHNKQEKNTVRKMVGSNLLINDGSDYACERIYTINWEKRPRLTPNSPEMQHLKPMVNLKELQEIVLLISLGIPTEEAISTITKQGYDS